MTRRPRRVPMASLFSSALVACLVVPCSGFQVISLGTSTRNEHVVATEKWSSTCHNQRKGFDTVAAPLRAPTSPVPRTCTGRRLSVVVVCASAGDDAGSGAEKMELRDFRARLLAKGLDGWGSDADNGTQQKQQGDERWAHTLVRPELGCLVLANAEMFTQKQQYFYRAVILVIQHGSDGTVGLILNRPTSFTMGDVCKGDLYRVPGMEDNVLYMGGDVAGARDDGLDVVNLMHGREDVPGMEVVKGLRLGGLKEALQLIAKGEAKPEEFKFFSRYAGWGPGQLEAEVLAKDWVLAACDLDSVLQNQNHPDQPGYFWNDIMSRLRRHKEREAEAERRKNE